MTIVLSAIPSRSTSSRISPTHASTSTMLSAQLPPFEGLEGLRIASREGHGKERPVVQEEGGILLREHTELLHGGPLVALVHLPVLLLAPLLAGLDADLVELAVPGLDTHDHVARVGDEVVVQGEGLRSRPIGSHPASDVGLLGLGVHQAELRLLMDRELGVLEALLVCEGLPDVTHVPLAHVGGGVAGRRVAPRRWSPLPVVKPSSPPASPSLRRLRFERAGARSGTRPA